MKTFNRFFVRAVLAASLLFGTSHLAQALEVGEKAPDFELDSTAGGKLKLSSLKGKNVLINVYVLDYSPTWIKHLMSAGSDDNYKKFTAENTEVLGMSANAAFSQKAFVDFVKVKYPLLSDRDGKAMKALGVWDEQRRLAKRSYILIDKEGVVRFINTRPTNTEKDLLSTETLLDEVKKINKN